MVVRERDGQPAVEQDGAVSDAASSTSRRMSTAIPTSKPMYTNTTEDAVISQVL